MFATFAELVALSPASSSWQVVPAVSVTSLRPISGIIPIVFAAVTDPVGAGFVDSLAEPVRKRHRLYDL